MKSLHVHIWFNVICMTEVHRNLVSKIILHNTLVVDVATFPSSSKISIFNHFFVLTLETIIYNWSCVSEVKDKFQTLKNIDGASYLLSLQNKDIENNKLERRSQINF